MPDPDPRLRSPYRAALAWCAAASLALGAFVPAVTVAWAPDQLGPNPLITSAHATSVGALSSFVALLAVALPAVALTGRAPALAHAPRAVAAFAATAVPALALWLVAARNGRLDPVTWGVAALLVAGLSLAAAAVGRALDRFDAQAARAAPLAVLLAIPLAFSPGTAPPTGRPPVTPTTPFTAAAAPATDRAPLVLLLTVDTLRADHLGAWGYARATSPVLDALAADGLRLADLTSSSSGTVPAFGALHTGLPPECTGVVHQLARLGPGAHTLAERFSDAGYATVAVVTNHALDEAHGFGQGFDRFEHLGEADATAVVDAALAALPTDRPTFAWIHLLDPHTPYVPPDALVAPFRGDALWSEEPVPLIDFGSFGGAHRTRTTGQPLPGATIPLGELVARYDAEIAHADEQLGRLLESLDAAGRLEGAVILFTADHGETLWRGRHDAAFQHALQGYQDDLHVPGVLWGPGRIPAGTVGRPVHHLDLVPTLLDAAGLPADLSLPGRSLLRDGPRPTVTVARSAWWDAASLKLVPVARRGPVRAIRDGDWKLVTWPRDGLGGTDPIALLDHGRSVLAGITQPDALYDLATDPDETTDVATRHPDVVARLRALLDAELARAVTERCAEVRGADLPLDADTRERLRAMGYLD